MEFTLTVNMDKAKELKKIFEKILRQLDDYTGGPIYDSNGNKVGKWGIKE